MIRWTERGDLPYQRIGNGARRVEPEALAAMLLLEGIPVPEALQRLLGEA